MFRLPDSFGLWGPPGLNFEAAAVPRALQVSQENMIESLDSGLFNAESSSEWGFPSHNKSWIYFPMMEAKRMSAIPGYLVLCLHQFTPGSVTILLLWEVLSAARMSLLARSGNPKWRPTRCGGRPDHVRWPRTELWLPEPLTRFASVSLWRNKISSNIVATKHDSYTSWFLWKWLFALVEIGV